MLNKSADYKQENLFWGSLGKGHRTNGLRHDKVAKRCLGSIPAHAMGALWWTNTACSWADL